MKTPVAFVIFNRPDQTRKVFEAIRAARPDTLLVIADGPRTDAERELCDATRSIIDLVDWPCDVQKNYSEKNLGCRARLSSGITWVFEQVDRAIILEDDCLPHPSFFTFCEDMLERYADDTRVMHVSGNFFQEHNSGFQTTESYYFSRIPHIWGWATWRRAWNIYDVDLTQWPALRSTGALKKQFVTPAAYEYWSGVWDAYHAKKIDSWDGQWFFACISHDGICITPTQNLVSNIGFGVNATHTKSTVSRFAHMHTAALDTPLIHPREIRINEQADAYTFRENFGIDKKWRYRLLRPIKNKFPSLYNRVKKIFKKNYRG